MESLCLYYVWIVLDIRRFCWDLALKDVQCPIHVNTSKQTRMEKSMYPIGMKDSFVEFYQEWKDSKRSHRGILEHCGQSKLLALMSRRCKDAFSPKRTRSDSYHARRRVEPTQRKRRLTASDSFVSEWQRAASQLETAASERRQERVAETQRRNTVNQKQPIQRPRSNMKKFTSLGANDHAKVENDRSVFFSIIDEPFSTACGSCGELVAISSAKRRSMDFNDEYFFPLLGDFGGSAPKGIYSIAITSPENDTATVSICDRCDKSLKRQEVPRYSVASGMVLYEIPPELSVLNDIEARMVGLGICFTSCYNIRGSGQECTKGHTINFWNDACRIAAILPRPLSKCGVIRMHTTATANESSIFTIRPNLIRLALLWLREHNPLYKNVEISESVLASLNEARLAKDDPTLVVEHEDTIRMNAQNVNDDTGGETSEYTESFELQTSGFGHHTQSEQILSAIHQKRTSELDVEMEVADTPINEYTTNTLMQVCFPTLFPDGCGGYNPISSEKRMHAFELADYCSHLMRWHDRRFVIHRNFKFFCLNLIQRRQVDGLTRRLSQNTAAMKQQDEMMGPHEKPSKESSADIKSQLDTGESELTKRGRAILKTLKPYFRSVRGSGLYWSDVRDELMGMIGNEVLPTAWPTFFFTLSAADTIWPDFFRACDPSLSMRQAKRLPARTRRTLLNQNPDIASRHFYRRFKAFFDHIINGEALPLGKITDYFWRVEFQRRGSPHIHGLLWVENAPDVVALSQTPQGCDELAAFVDRHISTMTANKDRGSGCICQVCTEKAKSPEVDILAERPQPSTDLKSTTCDVAELVARVQQHSCYEGASCRVKSGSCRFHFPKAVCDRTQIQVEQSGAGALKINVLCQRDDPFTNNYSAPLLQSWRANMDLKLIGNAYGAAEYTAAYVSKAEPDTVKFRAAIVRSLENSENRPELTVLRRVANASIATREVSAQEALWILQHNLPMFGKSRNVLKVKCLRHSLRFYRVDFDQCLHEMESSVDSEVTLSLPRMENIEKAYAARPESGGFSSMTFRHFCEHYEDCTTGPQPRQRLERWPRLDKRGFIKARQKSQAIVKTPRLRVDPTNADYCYSELFFNVPWRALSDLPQDDADCIEQYNANVVLNAQSVNSRERQRQMDMQEMDRESPVTEPLPEAPWTFVHQPEHPDLSSTNVTRSTVIPAMIETRASYTTNDYERARTFVKTVVKSFLKDQKGDKKSLNKSTESRSAIAAYRYPIGLPDMNMSDEQWIPFSLCMKQSRHRHTAAANNIKPTPLQMILNGEGGSGKSWLINHIVRDIHETWGDRAQRVRGSRRVLLMAHHGSAAFNIKGTTICSSLGLPQMNGNAYNRQYKPLELTSGGLKTLRRLQDKYANVQMIIIDEYSVISCGMLFWIDQRLREIWPTHRDVSFGGRDLILAGDMGQLSPVLPFSLATPVGELSGTQRCGRRLWESIKNVFTLESQNRGILDPVWFNALRRLREMVETAEDLALFNTRVLHEDCSLNWKHNATHIAYRNTDVNAANAECLTLSLPRGSIITTLSLFKASVPARTSTTWLNLVPKNLFDYMSTSEI